MTQKRKRKGPQQPTMPLRNIFKRSASGAEKLMLSVPLNSGLSYVVEADAEQVAKAIAAAVERLGAVEAATPGTYTFTDKQTGIEVTATWVALAAYGVGLLPTVKARCRVSYTEWLARLGVPRSRIPYRY